MDIISEEGDPVSFVARHIEALGRLWQSRIELSLTDWATQLERAEALAAEPGSMEFDDGERCVLCVERALRRVSRFVPGATCIHRALAAQRMLVGRGLQTEVVIGLRRQQDEIEGHAWIEVHHRDRIWRAFWGDGARYSVVR